MQRHDASATDSLRTNYPIHTFDFDFSHYCSSLLLYAGTPTLTPSTNTNAASTSCPIMKCLHERDRQHGTHHCQRAASMGYPCKHIYLCYYILFYLIWSDFILFYYIIFYPFICLYAHLVCPDFRKARLLTFPTTSNRSYTKGDEHTHASSLPTHASVMVLRRTCISITALRVWFFSVKSVSHHIAHPLA